MSDMNHRRAPREAGEAREAQVRLGRDIATAVLMSGAVAYLAGGDSMWWMTLAFVVGVVGWLAVRGFAERSHDDR